MMEHKRNPLKTRTHLFRLLRKYVKEASFRRIARYTSYLSEPIHAQSILYENFHGDSVGDSPAALFRELQRRPKYRGYKHVWVLKPTVKCPEWVLRSPNVEVVRVHSARYVKYLATCKYLINSTTFPSYFLRREGQVYVNTWHGTPLKTLGKDSAGSLAQHKNIQRNFVHATHLVSPNRYTSDKILESHDLDGLYSGTVIEVGYPRIDTTLSADGDVLRRKLMQEDPRPLLIFAPTWRGEVGRVDSDVSRLVKDVQTLRFGVADKYKVMLRVHPLTKRFLEGTDVEALVVPEEIETNELLAVTDLLVTDYSSIFFDFLVTGRPIVYYAHDLEHYRASRGMYLDLEQLPGTTCKSTESLVEAVRTAENWWPEHQQKLAKARALYVGNDDGDASRRVVDIVFEQKADPRAYRVVDVRKKLLFYCGGWLDNGITASAINLLNTIDHDRYQVIVVDKGEYDDVSRKNISRLNPRVKRFYRVGQNNASVRELYNQSLGFQDPIKHFEDLPAELYSREYRRLFGDLEFDVGIDFSGYVKFWTLVIRYGRFRRRVIYQHNQMASEREKVIDGKLKHKGTLDIIFRLYKHFDKVVCVSRETMLANKDALREFVSSPSSYGVVHNAISPGMIQRRSRESREITIDGRPHLMLLSRSSKFDTVLADLVPVPSEKTFTFVTSGRLSPEKGHEKLLHAFAAVRALRPNVCLNILGDGVLKNQLSKVRSDLGLVDSVRFLGQVENPFPLVRSASCFVLPSNHEGQPMVLLEALILGVPIVATDIPGNRSVLAGVGGYLVENTLDGVRDGMLEAIAGRVPKVSFDAERYNTDALGMFVAEVVGS